MTNFYVDELENIVKQRLSCAKKDVKICVAWINFNIYGEILKRLLCNGVRVGVILNDDDINNRYYKIIGELECIGAKIKKIKMPDKTKYMHHKFCIIDNKLCLCGSFNWTDNANKNNFENLIESDEINVLVVLQKEYNSLWDLSNNDIKILQKPFKCMNCDNPIVILCVISQDNDYLTKVEIFEVCDCQFRCINIEYCDISVYSNLISIYNKYNDMDEEFDYVEGDINKENIDILFNNEVEQYLSNIRNNRFGYQIIHAVGVYGFKLNSKLDQARVIKVLWKEKFINKLINDEYYLE